MGSTSKYGIPWPESTAFVKDGWSAMKLLAEGVEAALLPPLLTASSDAAFNWVDGVAEVAWDVDAGTKRGSWDTTGAAQRLIVPTLPGWYLVSASVGFEDTPAADSFVDVQIRSRAVGSAVGSGGTWTRHRQPTIAFAGANAVVGVAALVQIPESDPKTGFCVRLDYPPAFTPPTNPAGTCKIRAHRLSAL